MEPVLLIFTAGYVSQLIGNYLLIKKIREERHTEGLAFDTQVIYLIGSIVRAIWILETRLSGLFLVWLELALSIGSNVYLVYLFKKYKEFNVMNYNNPFKFFVLLAASAILSIFFHPGSKGTYFFTMQMLVSFTMFFEACGLLPQIYCLRKVEQVEKTTGRYVFSLAVSRIFRLAFWFMMWMDGDGFIYLMIADFLHTVLLGDFLFYFLRAKKGEPLILK
jgi:ER lumen protein retaining receptor